MSVEAISQKRNCTLVADSRNLTSKYWKLTQGDLSSPVDQGNKVKVFMCYPKNILNSEGIVVCSMCFAQNKENWMVDPKQWECNLGKAHSTTPLKRHLESAHRNPFTQWEVIQDVI